jgi:hypothetical protein
MQTKLTLLVFIFIAASIGGIKGYAQDPYDLPPPPDTPVDAPIDGGVSLLVAAGIAYGVKKAHETRKKNKRSEMKE